MIRSPVRQAEQTARDYYAEARALAAALAQLDQDSDTDQIHNAIAGGSTGTEILMALRTTLSQLLGNPALPNAIHNQARDLRDATNQAL